MTLMTLTALITLTLTTLDLKSILEAFQTKQHNSTYITTYLWKVCQSFLSHFQRRKTAQQDFCGFHNILHFHRSAVAVKQATEAVNVKKASVFPMRA